MVALCLQLAGLLFDMVGAWFLFTSVEPPPTPKDLTALPGPSPGMRVVMDRLQEQDTGKKGPFVAAIERRHARHRSGIAFLLVGFGLQAVATGIQLAA